MDWDAVEKAYQLVDYQSVTRVDGDGWKVYRVGNVIRIDIVNAGEDKN